MVFESILNMRILKEKVLTIVSHIHKAGAHKVKKSKNYAHKIAIIFLSISLNMCFGCSKEPSHRDSSFDYPQHMFWLRNKKINL